MRNSNIELCRVMAILLVIVVHSCFSALGTPFTYDDCWIPSLFIQSFSIIGVNVFVIISGWFSIVPTKKSIYNLLFICLFWGVLKIAASIWLSCDFSAKDLFFVSRSNWFVTTYLLLVCFAPILNKYVEYVTGKVLLKTIVILFLFQFWFGWVPAMPQYMAFDNGYSILSFMCLYLLSRYFRVYGDNGVLVYLRKYSFIGWLLCSVIIGFSALIVLRFDLFPQQLMGKIYAYNNPICVISSFCFFFIFESFQVSSLKLVNWISKSTLSVLLFHTIRYVTYKSDMVFRELAHTESVKNVVAWGGVVLLLYVLGVLTDQLRLMIWNIIVKQLKVKTSEQR